jgi:hypothetical protein
VCSHTQTQAFKRLINHWALNSEVITSTKSFVLQAGSAVSRQPADRLVLPSAFLLAGVGLGLSIFSVKQLLATARPRF